MQDKHSIKKSIFGALIFLIFIIGGYLIFSSYKFKNIVKVDNRLPVDVLDLHSKDVLVQRKYVGFITPINAVDVLPFVSGFIDKVKVVGGQDVNINDILFVINQDEYKALLDASYAQVLNAKAKLENAKLYYERMSKAGGRAVSKTDLDNAKTAFLSSEAELAQAIANYEKAKVDYNYTIIKATISGIVGDVNISKGDYVSPQGKALLKIIQYNPIRVVFSISDKEYINEVSKNANKKPFSDWNIKLRMANGEIFNEIGKVKFWDNEVASSTSSVKVFADFKNPNRVLYTNAYVDVIMERMVKNAILVPQSAVYLNDNQDYVYIVSNDDMPKKVSIDLGDQVDNYFVVNKGLNAGDKLILNKLSLQDLNKKLSFEIKNME